MNLSAVYTIFKCVGGGPNSEIEHKVNETKNTGVCERKRNEAHFFDCFSSEDNPNGMQLISE